MNLVVWDLESTSLKSDQGFILSAGFMPLGGKPYVLGLKEIGVTRNRLKIDKKLVAAVRIEMEKYDGVIGWNTLMFDLPLIDDRLLLCDEPERKRLFARGLDMMWHARMGKSRLTSSRLDWVAKVLGCPFKKTALDINLWKEAEAEAINGFRKGSSSYKYIIDHCEMDLKVTGWVYEKLKSRIQSISKK